MAHTTFRGSSKEAAASVEIHMLLCPTSEKEGALVVSGARDPGAPDLDNLLPSPVPSPRRQMSNPLPPLAPSKDGPSACEGCAMGK